MEEKNTKIETVAEMPKGLVRIDGQRTNKSKKEWNEKEIKKMRDRDREQVTGRFKFYEVKGGTLKFTYASPFKEDPIETWEMKDGEIYTIPLGTARHLENAGWYPVRRDKQHKNASVELDLNNKSERYRVVEKVQRYGFIPLGFEVGSLLDADKKLVSLERIV